MMKKYRCTVCDYIYDPVRGDPTADIPSGTPFEDLPDDWVCPDCGLGKDLFEEVTERLNRYAPLRTLRHRRGATASGSLREKASRLIVPPSPKGWLRIFLASALFVFVSIRYCNNNVNLGVPFDTYDAHSAAPDTDVSGMRTPLENDLAKHNMTIDKPESANASGLSPEELSERKGLWVEVSVSEQLLRVRDGAYLVKEMECTTGPETDPTPVGEFIFKKSDHWFSPGGPVRLSIPDSTWFYRHVPDGTVVVIHN